MSKATPQKSPLKTTERKSTTLPACYSGVRNGIVELLNAARQAVARNVNSLMTAS